MSLAVSSSLVELCGIGEVGAVETWGRSEPELIPGMPIPAWEGVMGVCLSSRVCSATVYSGVKRGEFAK